MSFRIHYTDKPPPRDKTFEHFFTEMPDGLEFATAAEAEEWVDQYYTGPWEGQDLDVEIAVINKVKYIPLKVVQ